MARNSNRRDTPILIIGEGGHKEQRVDAFEISGPGIGGQAVQPKEKLATSWGGIKAHPLRSKQVNVNGI
jgi:hypothetical protein